MASKRSKRRAKAHRKQQNQRVMLIGGAVAAIAILISVVVVTTGGSGNVPEIAQERLDLDPLLGPADAPVQLVEYGAYSCHACQGWHEAGIIEGIVAQYDGLVNFTFRDFPVISPRYDQWAAEMAQCVLDQDEDLFWQFHDALYTTHYANSSGPDLFDMAESLGADRTALRQCSEQEVHRQTVAYDLQRAREAGARGTPTFTVNGLTVQGGPDALVAAIDAALTEIGR